MSEPKRPADPHHPHQTTERSARGLDLALAERLLERSGEGMLAFDGDLRCLYWNPMMERLTGMKAADVVGQHLPTLFPFLSEIGEDALLIRAAAGEEVSSSHRPFAIPGTGRRGFFDAGYGPLDRGGAQAGGIGTVRDVTASLRASELLVETESRFRHMADDAPVLLWMADTDGLCTFFNQTWLSFTGRSQAEEWGVGWAAGIHFEDFQRCMDTYLEAFGRRQRFEMEYRLRRHDGEFRWLLDRGAPRYTPDGTFSGYIGSCIDITERKALEADLRRAVEARDEFLSVASHELKTPLTSLQLQIAAFSRQIDRRPIEALREGRLHAGGKALSDQTKRLADLIEVLLDVSRINSGRLRFEYAEVDLLEVLQDAMERWRAAAEAAGSAITLDEAPTTAGWIGTWERRRLDQIADNLLSNAIKYGAGRPIRLVVAASDRSVRFAVVDEGIGVSVNDQARIFQRFERAVSSRNYGGLGLGLWITNEVVTSLGGAVRLTSQPGVGSTFEVELPRVPPAATMRI